MAAYIFKQIEETFKTLDLDSIREERRTLLRPLKDYIKSKVKRDEAVHLNFICTHNSRRSYFSQVWAQLMAAHFGVPNVFAYSGGTEATALFPFVSAILEEQGFEVLLIGEGTNPVHVIKYGKNTLPVIGFSKTFDHPINPTSGFAAIMTCSQADSGCPFIPGSENRFSISYEDPKTFDGTPQQVEKYRDCSLKIATELLYVFSNISE